MLQIYNLDILKINTLDMIQIYTPDMLKINNVDMIQIYTLDMLKINNLDMLKIYSRHTKNRHHGHAKINSRLGLFSRLPDWQRQSVIPIAKRPIEWSILSSGQKWVDALFWKHCILLTMKWVID